MSTKTSRVLLTVLVVVLAVVIGLAALWFFTNHIFVGGGFYPKKAEYLNLRNQELTLEEYEELRQAMPDAQINWSVPFQGRYYSDDTTEISFNRLSDQDLTALGYLTRLETVHAENCQDHSQLLKLRELYPNVTLYCTVTVDGQDFSSDTTAITISSLSDREVALLGLLPNLTSVDAGECQDYSQLMALQELLPECQVLFTLHIGQETFPTDSAQITLQSPDLSEVTQKLTYFSNLEAVHMVNPTGGTADGLLALQAQYPDTAITWEVEILGMTVRSDATELNLMSAISPEGVQAYAQAESTPIQGNRDTPVMMFATSKVTALPDKTADTQTLISQVEAAMAYLPNVETVNMCGALLDNEAMAAFRDAHRQDYKVVWTVQCGGMTVRTDATYFMPTKYHVYYFQDHESGNLKYCEDMIAIDVGHMSVSDISFVSHMPHLKYLILAWTQVKDISPLASCKELVFLELDNSIVRDYSPLVECTGLKHLNLGNTYANHEPIMKLTWLENLWWIGRNDAVYSDLRDALPNTNTMFYGSATVANGWRELEDYYAMRDALGMPYMVW